jgi:hypothetical protein
LTEELLLWLAFVTQVRLRIGQVTAADVRRHKDEEKAALEEQLRAHNLAAKREVGFDLLL